MRPAALRVWLGSRNPAKLEAARLGFAPFFPALELHEADVASGVPEQPIGLDEIIAGARNRARAAYARAHAGLGQGPAGPAQRADEASEVLGVGIEDGLIAVKQAATGYLNVGCCVLYDGSSESLGLSAGFEYPPQCVAEAVGPERRPIGAAFEEVFRDAAASDAAAGPAGEGRAAVSGLGNIGRLTRGALTRAQYGAQAVTCALVRRLHPALYADTPAQAPGRGREVGPR